MQVTDGAAAISPAAAERRRQIVAATMQVLGEVGYAKTSFAKIAEHAGLSSTRLISYHFSGKDELMRDVLVAAKDAAVEFIGPRIMATTGHRAWLAAYITANMEFMRDRTAVLRALIELNSNARAALGDQFVDDAAVGSPLDALEQALREGQGAGAFRDFDAHVMAVALRAAIDTIAIGYAEDRAADVELFAAELVTLFDRATAA
ncbi:TetR family transcriptional regulator [Nocardia cyriacigeorgica]|uniref:TetR family transcriptional regulator n=1 Tax=Nocardia cyriacigeorgica TaxID=135487 RepID=A0A6P1D2A2_9NOCA|nr:TetR/AcrR family transcriptional regulator [Nocardia cyriacigeorgica]NEW39203.1 TetR family transcriptional regulator [Nocardia cyriacigeorgica]NEW43133.1 TetR family transcriptional regulator [Nocardia cyriacigeorgica]NEW49707.1 TetR family transcriptional regulator [Nocardia cyriacigeorgica]NEW56012.1 TetR family transcriptional regulator [Nocardia cyriacigeorgica]